MGKENSVLNLPANSSLSMTLDQLRTWVEVECNSLQVENIQWLPEMPTLLNSSRIQDSKSRDFKTSGEGSEVLPPLVPNLSEAGVSRMLNHARRVREAIFQIFPSYGLIATKYLSVQFRSANTFPTSSGIASSASSFAGVTLALALMSSQDPDLFESVWKDPSMGPKLRHDLAQVSRQGSGSSCRSFQGPWMLWEGEAVGAVKTSLPSMTDLIVLISSDTKEVTSSQAHALVQTSPLWQGRVGRAQARF